MAMRGENLRFWSPVAVLLCFAAYSGIKLVRSHVNPEVSAPDYYFTRNIDGRRGTVYSAGGKNYPFVKSVPFWEYHLDPVALTNSIVRRRGEPPRPKAAIVKTIADALGLDYRRLMRMSENSRKRYQFLALSSNPEAHRTLADSRLVAGVSIEDRQVRQYLHGRRLSHVLGSVNADHVGSAGIEQRYNRELSGTPGVVRGMKDARGRELYDKRIVSVDPIPGADIYLTVDHNLQYEAETALKWGIGEYGAAEGWCIVMDARSAAILAMASMPDFEPLAFGHTPDDAKINRAVAFNYEPGSVMKVMTAAAAIDAGIVKPTTLYRTNRDDPRYYRLPGDGSHAWEPLMTVKDAIVKSSNIVIGKLSWDLGPQRLWTYLRRFGFGDRTGIELPGEQYGIMWHWGKWDRATWSRAGIGQGVSVTAIQLISAYQAIANDGLRMKPYIVERIVKPDGSETKHEPAVAGRVISAATARAVREMMTGVAAPGGTARRAAIKGFSIAGKTGTAQKSVGRTYAPGLYRATFCGIVPASSPRIVVLVTLDFDERTRYHQGGNSAGPVFKRITESALRYLMISPDRPEDLEDVAEDWN